MEQTETDGATLPAIYQHAGKVYRAMEASSTREDVQVDGEVKARLVWRGHLTSLVQQLGFSVPYYSQIRQCLIQMGCAHQIRRGGGGSESVWVLIRRPTAEEFLKYNPAVRQTVQKRRTDVQIVLQRVADLEKRIATVEQMLNGLTVPADQIDWTEVDNA